jgi:polyisoprenyl-teichoic acid--peptidoglycan teichoic acid transferase
MRIPTWAITVWVLLAVVGGLVGGFLSYTQSRERTRDLNDITSLQEGVDVVEIVGLLAGWREPELPETERDAASAPDLSVQADPAVLTATPTPQTPLTDAATDDIAADQLTPTPNAVPTEADETPPVAVAEDELAPSVDFGLGRINVLLMGIDQREGETGPFPTDTMIVLSLNPAAQSGVILSIPRDIYVRFPASNGRRGKINTANIVGENLSWPGGGVEYAKRTVSEFLGVPIDYYVMVNFTAFLDIMDVIGPVEVCIPEAIEDLDYPDGSYGTRPVYFDPGCQDLPPDRLLEYSRTRATANGDIDRAARQQQVMLAVREKVVTVTGLSNLIRNAAGIWESVSDNIRTDMSFEDVYSLAFFMDDVAAENIVNATIGYDRVEIGTSPEGEEILIPIQSDIVALVTELFGS